jgi:hypothetical protein
MPPVKLPTFLETSIAALLTEMAPVLVMPPPGPPEPNIATRLTTIPCDFAVIVPLLLIPPVKVVTSLIWMPLEPAAILPPLLLTMPPAKSESLSTKTPALECPPEIVPLLVMPPKKVDTKALVLVGVAPTKMPAADFTVIVPPLLLTIPPAKVSTRTTRIPSKVPVILPLLTIAPPLPEPPAKVDS